MFRPKPSDILESKAITKSPLDDLMALIALKKTELQSIASQISSLESKQDQATAAAALHALGMENLMLAFQAVPAVTAHVATMLAEAKEKKELINKFFCNPDIVALLDRDESYHTAEVVLQRLRRCQSPEINQKVREGKDYAPVFRPCLTKDEISLGEEPLLEMLSDAMYLGNTELSAFIIANCKFSEAVMVKTILSYYDPLQAQRLIEVLISGPHGQCQEVLITKLIDRGWLAQLDLYASKTTLDGIWIVLSAYNAAKVGRFETVKHLCSNSKYFSVFEACSTYRANLFGSACQGGNLDLVKYLASFPAISACIGSEALVDALNANQQKIAEYLIDVIGVDGSAINVRDPSENTTLQWFAARRSRIALR